VLLSGLMYYRKRLHEHNVELVFGMLYENYKPKLFWWEAVWIGKRIGIAFASKCVGFCFICVFLTCLGKSGFLARVRGAAWWCHWFSSLSHQCPTLLSRSNMNLKTRSSLEQQVSCSSPTAPLSLKKKHSNSLQCGLCLD
jgi:hypothetical protein